MKDFEIIGRGSKYLKVFHLGAKTGAVGKKWGVEISYESQALNVLRLFMCTGRANSLLFFTSFFYIIFFYESCFFLYVYRKGE